MLFPLASAGPHPDSPKHLPQSVNQGCGFWLAGESCWQWRALTGVRLCQRADGLRRKEEVRSRGQGVNTEPTERRGYRVLMEAKKVQRERENTILEPGGIFLCSLPLLLLSWAGWRISEPGKTLGIKHPEVKNLRIKAGFAKARACCLQGSSLKNDPEGDLTRGSLYGASYGPRVCLPPQKSRAGSPGESLLPPSLPPSLTLSAHPELCPEWADAHPGEKAQKRVYGGRYWGGGLTLGQSPGGGDASEIKWGNQDLRGTFDKLGRSRWVVPGHTHSQCSCSGLGWWPALSKPQIHGSYSNYLDCYEHTVQRPTPPETFKILLEEFLLWLSGNEPS